MSFYEWLELSAWHGVNQVYVLFVIVKKGMLILFMSTSHIIFTSYILATFPNHYEPITQKQGGKKV